MPLVARLMQLKPTFPNERFFSLSGKSDAAQRQMNVAASKRSIIHAVHIFGITDAR
jgi:hypothetical protein